MTDRTIRNNRPDIFTLNKHLKEAYLKDVATVTKTATTKKKKKKNPTTTTTTTTTNNNNNNTKE